MAMTMEYNIREACRGQYTMLLASKKMRWLSGKQATHEGPATFSDWASLLFCTKGAGLLPAIATAHCHNWASRPTRKALNAPASTSPKGILSAVGDVQEPILVLVVIIHLRHQRRCRWQNDISTSRVM